MFFAPKKPKLLDHYVSDSTFRFSLVDSSDCSKIYFNVVNFTPARLIKTKLRQKITGVIGVRPDRRTDTIQLNHCVTERILKIRHSHI